MRRLREHQAGRKLRMVETATAAIAGGLCPRRCRVGAGCAVSASLLLNISGLSPRL